MVSGMVRYNSRRGWKRYTSRWVLRVALHVWDWNMDLSQSRQVGGRLSFFVNGGICPWHSTREDCRLGTAWIVAFAPLLLSQVYIPRICPLWCIPHWSCEANIHHVAWYITCCILWDFQLVTASGTRVNGVFAAIVQRLSVLRHQWGQCESDIHHEYRNNGSQELLLASWPRGGSLDCSARN